MFRVKVIRRVSAPSHHYDELVRTDASGVELLFETVADAVAKTPGARRDGIFGCIGGRHKTHRGYRWHWKPAPVIENEVWCCLWGREYAGIEVSDMGRVRGTRISYGFLCNFCHHTTIGNRRFPVHRLVCRAFHGLPCTSNLTVEHIDRNRHNNQASNLRWKQR